ncbi:MAG TPA: flagellar protein FliS [Candidatus Binataceae bacterium]|nr:flagellar protein FliS [Candidatus Binataceae bacterium]
MGHFATYGKYQSISLEGEAAYEELYTRLARWTSEAIELEQEGNHSDAEAKLDRCIEILGYMDRGIDMSRSRDIALGIMSLHRFAVTELVKAKGECAIAQLEPLIKIFVSLADIFSAIRAGQVKS